MPTELRWLLSTSTSSLHAASAILHSDSITNDELIQSLTAPAELLAREISTAGFNKKKLLSQLVPLSASIDNNQQLADTAIRKAFGPNALSEDVAARIAGAISDIENAFIHAHPNAVGDLETRGRVLREQWESRGPGMLATISRITERGLLPEQADVVLVHPALGGGGMPFMKMNLVTIEAVLTNPSAELPEVVRLGWMLSTLNLDLPLHCDTIQADRLPVIGSLAMLPAALQAASDVEWCHDTPQLLQQAITDWKVGVQDPASVADVVTRWWETYQSAQPRWSVALAALDQTLPAAGLLSPR